MKRFVPGCRVYRVELTSLRVFDWKERHVTLESSDANFFYFYGEDSDLLVSVARDKIVSLLTEWKEDVNDMPNPYR